MTKTTIPTRSCKRSVLSVAIVWAIGCSTGVHAGVLSSQVTLSAHVNATRSGGSGLNDTTTLTAGQTGEVGVSQTGVGRFASSSGAAVFNNASSGSVRFNGSFIKRPEDFSAGFAAPTGELVYRFEADASGTLFLESANSASILGDGGFALRSPSWRFNGALFESSGIGTSDNWSIDFDAGVHELILNPFVSPVAWAERSFAGAEFTSVFNWGIDSLPGTLDNPFLPVEVDSGDFGFDIITSQENRYYDPVIATGYDYVAGDVPFASVLIPEALPNGDSEFQLVVGSQTFNLFAGQAFDLTSINAGGVSEFGIRGIDTSEMLDPDDPTAFITGLSFTEGGKASTFRMSSFTGGSNVVPEPSSFVSCLGLLAIGFIRRSRRTSPASRQC